MNFWRIKAATPGKVNFVTRTLLATAAGVITTMMPLRALATTPPSGAFEVGSTTSGICMQASGETSGSSVVLASCNNQINQKWYLNRAGYYQGQIAYDIETAKAGSFQCLSNSSNPANIVNLADCNGINSVQRFVWVNGDELLNVATSECLDSTTPGASLVLNPCASGASSQMWFQVPNSAKP